MKRSGFGPRKTPLKRGSWKSSPVEQKDWRAEVRATPKRSTFTSKPKRVKVAEGAKYLAACRGEECFLAVLCCGGWADPTVVPCHSNFAKHGKAGARKADHEFSVPGCMACHAWLDTGPAPYELKVATFDGALDRWKPRRARKLGIELLEAA